LIKKLRLLIANLALKSDNITLDEAAYVLGVDLKTSLGKFAQEFELMRAKVDTLRVDLTPEIITKIITASDKISDSQKIKIVEILQSPDLHDASYLG